MWVSFLMWPTFHVCVFLFSCCSVVQDLMPSLMNRLVFGRHLHEQKTTRPWTQSMCVDWSAVGLCGGGSWSAMCLCLVENQMWVHLLPSLRWGWDRHKPICRPAVRYDQLVGPFGSLGIALMVRGMPQESWYAHTSFCLVFWYFHFYWPACYARYFICMTLIGRLCPLCVCIVGRQSQIFWSRYIMSWNVAKLGIILFGCEDVSGIIAESISWR